VHAPGNNRRGREAHGYCSQPPQPRGAEGVLDRHDAPPPAVPEVLLAFCRLSGFDSGEVRFPVQSGNFDADVYSNRDYAVLARAAPA
jgi:hypothetical protein